MFGGPSTVYIYKWVRSTDVLTFEVNRGIGGNCVAIAGLTGTEYVIYSTEGSESFTVVDIDTWLFRGTINILGPAEDTEI
jgi:hypothetical protein